MRESQYVRRQLGAALYIVDFFIKMPGQMAFSFRGCYLSGLFIWLKGGCGMTNLVGVIMGSKSDWETMKHACDILEELEIAYEKKVVSAHRTPDLMFTYAEEAREKGIKVIIAGAGGAAHLPGMVAAKTTLPVIGVPVQSKALNGLDSLLSIVQMPGGVPVATVAIGKAGAVNAGLLAAQILSTGDADIARKLEARRIAIKEEVLESGEQLV
jgi:5-(carboxyamino)imidazole ribonucleotide mutase